MFRKIHTQVLFEFAGPDLFHKNLRIQTYYQSNELKSPRT